MGRAPQPPRPGQTQTVTLNPGQSIQQAIDANPAGTTFQFSAGTWREQEFLSKANNRFIGAAGGGTVLSGARVLDQWRRDGQYWRCQGLPDTLGDNKPAVDPLANHLNELFVDDRLLKRVGAVNEVDPNTWWYDDNGGAAVIGFDPANHRMEYSVTRNQTWNNGQANGCHWQDITVEKYCSDAQQGAHHGLSNWTYQNATFRQMHGVGVALGENTIFEGGKTLDNGQAGIEGYQAHNCRVENTEIARNGWVGYNMDWDGGGLKIVSSDSVILRNNNVHHNKDQGLWGDIDCTNWLVEGNTVEDNEGCGIMYEISYGETRIQNNVCNRNGGTGGYGAGGIYVSNSMGVDVSNNRIEVKPGNTAIGGGIAALNQDRGAGNQGVYEARNINIHHNTITHSNDTALDGYWVYKPINNPGIALDWNTYIVRDVNARHWRYVDADLTWDELKATGQEPNGTVQQLGEGGGGNGGEQPPPGGGNGGNGGSGSTLAPGTYSIPAGSTLIVA